ncbi:MAG: hypothetical protein K6U79_11050, partial [Firmicutes bacterium]|nr:hypothetical protein [Bacillota bacterium]
MSERPDGEESASARAGSPPEPVADARLPGAGPRPGRRRALWAGLALLVFFAVVSALLLPRAGRAPESRSAALGAAATLAKAVAGDLPPVTVLVLGVQQA